MLRRPLPPRHPSGHVVEGAAASVVVGAVVAKSIQVDVTLATIGRTPRRPGGAVDLGDDADGGTKPAEASEAVKAARGGGWVASGWR